MSENKEIPWEIAEKIANDFDKDQVIIVAWDKAHEKQHVVTYGKTDEDSWQAAKGGNFVKKALGWPPDHYCSIPERFKKRGDDNK